jgi:hypothetical protein
VTRNGLIGAGPDHGTVQDDDGANRHFPEVRSQRRLGQGFPHVGIVRLHRK